MFHPIIIALIIIIFVLCFILLFRFLYFFKNNDTKIIRLLFISFTCFGLIILIPSSKIFIIDVYGLYDDFWDRSFSVFNFVLIFTGSASGLHILFIINEQIGMQIKYTKLFRNSYYIFAIFFSSLNALTCIPIYLNEYGFFIFQIHPIVLLLAPIVYSPTIIIQLLSITRIYKKFEDKMLARNYVLLQEIIIFFPLGGFIYGGIFNFFPVYEFGSQVYFAFNILLMFIVLILYFRHPDLIGKISIYFCLNSLFIIRKGGQFILGQDFKKKIELSEISSHLSLLGAFLQTIEIGLKEITELPGEVDSVKIGKIYIIFKKGVNCFGILFASENTIALNRKLEQFVDQFEKMYERELLEWNGNTDPFKSKPFQDLIYDIFRY